MKKAYFLAFLFFAAIFSAVFYFTNGFQKNNFLPPDPEYAKNYSITDAFCADQNLRCDDIQFTFDPSEKAKNLIPPYEIHEINEEARAEIVFHKISNINAAFDYLEVTNSNFIDELDYYQVGEDFFLSVARKGELNPIIVKTEGNIVKIKFINQAASHFSAYNPPENSSVYPTKQDIKLEVTLKNTLADYSMFVNNDAVNATVSLLENNRYSISYKTVLENEQQYKVKVIITDSEQKAAAAVWEFAAQKALASALLEKDRFKYLGWWGTINYNKSGVYKEPTRESKRLGTFSTINRVKVLEEFSGEMVGENNLWYKIDGGMYSGAYVFSADVKPMPQPAPPEKFTIPSIVKTGEYWVDTDLTKKILTLFLYDKPVFATYISPGIPYSPTPLGTYKVWYKLTKTRMRGRVPVVSHNYDLPNVPYVMFYKGPYSLHGTYWHDKFGTRQSSGCTNLTQGDAKYIFDLTLPALPEGQIKVFSSVDNPGLVIYNHN